MDRSSDGTRRLVFVEKRGGAPEGSDKGAARNYIRFSQNYMKHLEATQLSF